MDILSYLISLVSMAIAIYLAAKFVKYITYFSKFFFALILAVNLNPHIILISGNSFGNGAALFAILVVLCLLLGLFPRTNFAITFFFNFLLIFAVSLICVDVFLPKIFEGFKMSNAITAGVSAVGAFISFKVLLTQIEGGNDIIFLPLRILDRVVGSLINSLTLMIALLTFVYFPDNNVLFFVIMGAVAAVMFVADIFLFNSITGMAHVELPKSHFSLLDMLSSGSLSAGFSGSSHSSHSRSSSYYDPDNPDRLRHEQQDREMEQQRMEQEKHDKQQFDNWYKENYGDPL